MCPRLLEHYFFSLLLYVLDCELEKLLLYGYCHHVMAPSSAAFRREKQQRQGWLFKEDLWASMSVVVLQGAETLLCRITSFLLPSDEKNNKGLPLKLDLFIHWLLTLYTPTLRKYCSTQKMVFKAQPLTKRSREVLLEENKRFSKPKWSRSIYYFGALFSCFIYICIVMYIYKHTIPIYTIYTNIYTNKQCNKKSKLPTKTERLVK